LFQKLSMYKESAELKIRRAFDFLFNFFIIMLISPVLLIIAIAIRLEDGGAVFITQEKVGTNGRRFPVYKFRTMRTNHEAKMISLSGQNEQTGPVFKIMNDPKVTRIGRLLRKTSVDELPLFFNMLRGKMSVADPMTQISSEI
jgi:lipopolysaccharide/colanic/teichoic acid biosynthesis glycosyltransferase